jgi:7,8-dihydropterin-6-yl-methyl-4-(beta-D-ribofuranosyl)aminobenzene 5'-phosphate synthase
MVELQPVDAVEVTLVVDNFVDILIAEAEGARRFPLAYDHFDQDQLVAEHGFSALSPAATHRLAAAFPGAFIQPSVGTVLRF